MTRPSLSELEKLARGQSISREAFLSLLSNADPEVRGQLAKAAQVQSLFDPGREQTPSPLPPAMPVTFEELAAFQEGSLDEPARRAAVESFLREQFPEALSANRPAADPDEETPTAVQLASGEEPTKIDRPNSTPGSKGDGRGQ